MRYSPPTFNAVSEAMGDLLTCLEIGILVGAVGYVLLRCWERFVHELKAKL